MYIWIRVGRETGEAKEEKALLQGSVKVTLLKVAEA
jgi:hypothetical protein